MKKLTGWQKIILDLLHRYISERGYAPSIEELADSVGRRPNAAAKVLDRLEQGGYIRRGTINGRRIARNIIVIDPPEESKDGSHTHD
jgi:SOS-response transcriptional repressor LexA